MSNLPLNAHCLRKMKKVHHLILNAFLICSSLSGFTQSETSADSITDSICTQRFYKSINEFLNPERAVINTYDEELVPCCMKLIINGDTTAKNILYERIGKRIEKFRQNESDYISVSKIIPETLGRLPEPRSLELCMLLFEYKDVLEFGGDCFQLGYSVFRDAILNVVSLAKAEEYKYLAALKYREAIARGLHDCEAEAYVVSYIYPIVKSDMINGELDLREP